MQNIPNIALEMIQPKGNPARMTELDRDHKYRRPNRKNKK